MKRDMDLIREILLAIEELPPAEGWYNLEIEARSTEEIVYHVRLMNEAGLIEAIDLSGYGDSDWRPVRITYAGHEFIDAARSDGVWQCAKNKLLSTAGALTLEGMKLALPATLKSMAGLVDGILK